MTVARPTALGVPRSHRNGRIVAPSALSVLIGVLILTSPGAAAWSYGTGDPVAWSNGVVLCQFAPVNPSVAVSAASLSGSGVTVALLSLFEDSPSSSVAAVANVSALSWTVENWSTEDAFDLAYSVHAPLTSPTNTSRTVGSTELTVQFVLPAYQGSPEGPTDSVEVVFWVDNWTWQNAEDHLVLTFAAAPSFPASEHLNASAAPGWQLASTSNSSGNVLEQVGANTTALAATGTGPSAPVAANPSLAIASPSSARVSVTFAGSAGAFTSLTYTARVAVVLPASIAGIPLSEIAAVGAAGILVSLSVAFVTRRLRSRPSKLVYVTEEEKP